MDESNSPSLKREIIENLIGMGILYLSLHPHALEELRDKTREYVNGIRHSFSVWQAQLAIRKLPETVTTETTEIKREE